MRRQKGEVLITVLIVIPLVFGTVEHFRAKHHKNRADAYAEQVVLLESVSNDNQQAAQTAAEVARDNAELIENLDDDLNQCLALVEEYRLVKNSFENNNQTLARRSQELEKRLAESDLSQCRVPDWLVDEITGRNY